MEILEVILLVFGVALLCLILFRLFFNRGASYGDRTGINFMPVRNEVHDIRNDDDALLFASLMPELEKLEDLREEKRLIYEYRKPIAIKFAIIGTPIALYLDLWKIEWLGIGSLHPLLSVTFWLLACLICNLFPLLVRF